MEPNVLADFIIKHLLCDTKRKKEELKALCLEIS
jgi:hypothetical protein